MEEIKDVDGAIFRLEDVGDDYKLFKITELDGSLLFELEAPRPELYNMMQGLYNSLKADVDYSYVFKYEDEVVN